MTVMFFRKIFSDSKRVDGWMVPTIRRSCFHAFSCVFFFLICALIDKSGWKSLAEFTGMESHHAKRIFTG